MRVLITSTYYKPYISGVTECVSLMANHYSQKNPVTILCFQHSSNLQKLEQSPTSPTPPRLRGASNFQLPTSIVRLPVHLSLSKGFINFFYPFYALKQVLNNDFVVMNLPQFEAFWIALFAKILHKKSVVWYHCDLAFENSWWQSLIVKIVNTSHFFTCLFCNQILVYSKDYAVASPVLKYFTNKLTILPFPPFLSPVVSDLEIRNSDLKQNHFVLGFVGRISSEKGLEYLLNALDILKNKGLNVQLICAGPNGKNVAGENNYFQKIQKIVQEKKLNVQFLGILEREKLEEFYKQIDLLVFPSTNRTETFGIVQIEALMSGTPIVASNLEGINIPINLTSYGLLAKPKDAADLSDKIALVLKTSAKYHPNIQRVKEIFDVNKVYKIFDSLFP